MFTLVNFFFSFLIYWNPIVVFQGEGGGNVPSPPSGQPGPTVHGGNKVPTVHGGNKVLYIQLAHKQIMASIF